jgi:hypothetical protein
MDKFTLILTVVVLSAVVLGIVAFIVSRLDGEVDTKA